MAVTITGEQLQRALELHQNHDTSNVWKYLGSVGDKYAASAALVTGDPLSAMGQIVRNTWYEAGADFSKFDKVAHEYQGLYLSKIRDSSNGDGTYRLPSSTQIEQYYLGALKENEVSPYAAIDADLALANIKANEYLGTKVVTWPQIVGLEPERTGPVSQEVLALRAGQGAKEFARVFFDTGATEAATQLYSGRAAIIDNLNSLNNWLGRTQEPSIEFVGGLNFLSSPDSATVAMFDNSNKGQAYFDRRWQPIDASNWRNDPLLNQYEFKPSGAGWQGTRFTDPGVNAFISGANSFQRVDGQPGNFGSGGADMNYVGVPGDNGNQPAIPLEDIFTQRMLGGSSETPTYAPGVVPGSNPFNPGGQLSTPPVINAGGVQPQEPDPSLVNSGNDPGRLGFYGTGLPSRNVSAGANALVSQVPAVTGAGSNGTLGASLGYAAPQQPDNGAAAAPMFNGLLNAVIANAYSPRNVSIQ